MLRTELVELLIHGFDPNGIELGFEAKMADAALELALVSTIDWRNTQTRHFQRARDSSLKTALNTLIHTFSEVLALLKFSYREFLFLLLRYPDKECTVLAWPLESCEQGRMGPQGRPFTYYKRSFIIGKSAFPC